MKQIALAIALWIIGVSSVLAQCNGVFPNNTVCGNTSGSTALPYSIPIGSSVGGPSSSTVGDFATWNNNSGSLLANTTPSEALTTLGNGEAPTGSGAVVLATSPALTTPSLGVATATSINGLSIDTTTGVLDIANGKTLTDTSGVGADLLLGATGGGFAAYGGASCTNQVFTALSAAGSPTCSTVTNADLANDSITIAGTSVALGGSTSSLPSPGPIGGTTPSSVAATTISASGQITSTESTGTAPFVVASTTEVSNLNVAALQGDTWAAPGTIGSTTPNTGAFTTIAGDDATLSAVDPFVALNGDTSTSEGPYVEFERGGTEFGAIGSESVLIGGNNSDLALLAESGDTIQFYVNGDTTADVAIPSKATLDVGYSGGGGAVVIGGSASGTTTLSASATAGTTTATLPDNTGTLAELNLAQTWSAVQTFDTSDLAINGGSATAGLATVTSAGVLSSEANATVAQGGTGGTSASGTLLDNITGFSSTGLIDRTGAGAYSFTPPGTNVLTALGNAINAASGLPNVDGSIVTGDCLKWGPGIEDAGVTCGSGGGGSPGGSNGALQYNDSGSFGGVTIASGDIPLGGGSGAPTDSLLSPTGTGWTTVPLGDASTKLATDAFADAVAIKAAGGRLTLTSHTPVQTTSVTSGGVSTLYYDAYYGNTVPVYNGTNDQIDVITSREMEDLLPTSSTGVANAGGVFDEWFYDNSGSPVICHATNGSGGGWASDSGSPSNTARGTGYSELDNHTRSFVTNANSITYCYNGSTQYSPGANQATYLGTFATDASNAGKVDFTLGSSAAGGGEALIGIWNYYNRVPITTSVVNSTTDYSYSSTTVRAALGSDTFRVQAVFGAQEEPFSAQYQGMNETATNAICYNGIGLNSTTAYFGVQGVMSAQWGAQAGSFYSSPLSGLNYLQALQNTNGDNCAWNNPQNSSTDEALTATWRY